MKRQQRHQQGRRSITLGAGIMVFAVLASALAGCKSGLTENPSAPLEQNSQTEAILEESLESSQIPLEDMTVLLEPEDEYTIWDKFLKVKLLEPREYILKIFDTTRQTGIHHQKNCTIKSVIESTEPNLASHRF